MKTINERAHDAVGHPIHKGGMQTPDKLSFEEQVFINGYIKGATDQKEIDNEEWQKDMRYVNIRKQELIEKACEWLQENVNNYLYNTGGFEEYIPQCGDAMFIDFRKALEE